MLEKHVVEYFGKGKNHLTRNPNAITVVVPFYSFADTQWVL